MQIFVSILNLETLVVGLKVDWSVIYCSKSDLWRDTAPAATVHLLNSTHLFPDTQSNWIRFTGDRESHFLIAEF